MARSIYEIRKLPIPAQQGFAAGVAVGSLVGVVGNTHLPSYTDYVPTWTATGTAPAVGNAVVTARWIQVGKLIHAEGSIVFGTTSSYGTGAYKFALPAAAGAAVTGTTIAFPGTFYLLDASSNNTAMAVANFASTTTVSIIYPSTYLGAQTNAGQLAPWTWTTSDAIGWNIVYEAA